MENSSDELEHTAYWQAKAGSTLYEVFAEIWAWRAEVDEIVSEFIGVVLGFEERLEDDVLNVLVGYTWQRTETTHFGLRETTIYEEMNGVIFTEDGWLIAFGDDLATRFSRIDISFDDGGRRLSNADISENDRILPHYDFSIDINENFAIETESIEIMEDLTGNFERLTDITLTRDLSEITPENQDFLEALRLETVNLLETSFLEIRQREVASPILYSGATALDGDTRLFSLLAYRIAIHPTGEAMTSYSSIATGNQSSEFVRIDLNQNLLRQLLGELEAHQEMVLIFSSLIGEWRGFEEVNGESVEWELSITGSEYSPSLFMVRTTQSFAGGGAVDFAVTSDGSYMIRTDTPVGGSPIGEGNTPFTVSEDTLTIDDRTYFRYGSDLYLQQQQ